MNNERTVFVIYAPGLGFGKGTGASASWDADFSRARVYKAAGYAKTSAIYRRAIRNKQDVVIVPIKLILDPEKLFEAALGGKLL